MGGAGVVGRLRERVLLSGSLEEAAGSRGRVVLLTGEAGMGKTTLADELVGIARSRGVAVARGQGWEGRGSPPLVVWREVLLALGNGLEGPLDAEVVHRLLVTACARGPVLVVLEDLHAADADSARLLAQLSYRLGELPVLVLATLREEELRERPGAAEALLSVSSTTRRVAVPALTVEGVTELATLLSGTRPTPEVVQELVLRSDGNAFFVRELVEAAHGADVPAGVAATVRQRVQSLEPEVVAVLLLAACAGRELALPLVAGAASVSVPEVLELLGRAVRAGLLLGDGPAQLRFKHALVADALVADLLPGERTRLHLQLAAAAQQHQPVDAVTVAHHLAQAGPVAEPGEVVRWSTLAGEQAEAAGAPLEAVRHLRRAVAAETRSAAQAVLQERIGHCLFNAGARPAEAVLAFEAALLGHELAKDRRRCGIVHSRLASHLSLYRHTSDFTRAARHFEAAEELLVDPLDRAHLLVGRSTMHLLRGHPDAALADAQEALLAATGRDRPALESTARLMTGAALLALARLDEGLSALDRSFSPGAVQRPTVDVQTAWHGIVAGVVLEDPALACSYAERAQRALSGSQLPGQAQIVSDLLAPAHALAGRVAQARGSLAAEDLLGFEVERQGVVPVLAGDWAGTRAVLEQMLHRDVASGHGVRVAVLCWALGRLLRQQGELEAARNHLERGARLARRDGRRLDELRLLVELALVDGADGSRDRVAAHLERCAVLAAGQDLRGLRLRLRLAAANSLDEVEAVVADADRRGLPLLAVEALVHGRHVTPGHAASLTARARERLDGLGLLDTGWGSIVCDVAAPSPCSLRWDGASWGLQTPTGTAHLPASLGLTHLARLLAAPGREWYALDLASLAARGEPGGRPTPAQPFLDDQARRAYRIRLDELALDLAEAERDGDEGAVERAQRQRQELAEHLAAALGLGGSARGWSGPAEKARQSVTKTLRSAVVRIEAVDSLVAAHLRASLRTGTWCSYAPDPSASLAWDVAGSG